MVRARARFGGRGESLLSADQDNALVHAGTEEDDGWFAALGSRLADLLDEAGVRRCSGGIMASNREWRGTVPAWRERVDGWLRRSTPEDLLHVDIFYDLAPVAGTLGLGRELHAVAVEAAQGSPAFTSVAVARRESMRRRHVARSRSPSPPCRSRSARSGGFVRTKEGSISSSAGCFRSLASRAPWPFGSGPGRGRLPSASRTPVRRGAFRRPMPRP